MSGIKDKVLGGGKSDTGGPSGGQKEVEGDDLEELLIALGKMFMFAKVVEKKVERGDYPNEKIAKDFVTDVSSECIEFMGVFEVNEICKNNGLDWENDILGGLR